MPDDLMFRPVDELAGLVRGGELSARELVQASLDAIDARNGDVNAFVDVFAEEALAAADAVGRDDDRPFAGVPIAIKNNRAVEGKRLTFAAELIGDFAPPFDHNVTARLKAAGFIVVGTTTLPEYGILPTTETRRFGVTRNPWDLGRTPGGSSGGSAAAVAAGMVPIAHANDGGGSTRIPAACCGLVGLKPQRGRISVAPELGQLLLVTDGVLTRTVRETAQLLDVLQGYVTGDLSWAPPPQEPFAVAAGRAPAAGLRIAMTTTTPQEGLTVDAVCVEAMRETGRQLEALGHHVEEVDAPWQMPGVAELFTATFGPGLCAQMAFAGMIAGREPTEEDMAPLSWAMWQMCAQMTSTQAFIAEAQLHGIARQMITWADQYDAVLTPSLAQAPLPVGVGIGEAGMHDFTLAGEFSPYTAGANLTGLPAISLPVAVRPDDDPEAPGVPVGAQLLGRPATEGSLLALSAQLEAAMPWADRRAPAA